VPRLRAAVFYLRLGLVAGAATFGLFGYMAALFTILVRIASLKSFGVDATPALAQPTRQRLKDTAVRAHFSVMRTRPAFNRDRVRMRYNENEELGYEDIYESESREN
jgi:spore germination protein KA